MARTIDLETGEESGSIVERQEKKNKKVAMADAPTWPMDKWPHPTPGQGPLPNTKLPKKPKV